MRTNIRKGWREALKTDKMDIVYLGS